MLENPKQTKTSVEGEEEIMTHLWKSKEEYTFDMPGLRVDDVYGKNARLPLWPYLKHYNPKISEIKFDKTLPLLHVVIEVPKYPKSRPYFNNEDVKTLLETYMNYANATLEEISAWYKTKSRNNAGAGEQCL